MFLAEFLPSCFFYLPSCLFPRLSFLRLLLKRPLNPWSPPSSSRLSSLFPPDCLPVAIFSFSILSIGDSTVCAGTFSLRSVSGLPFFSFSSVAIFMIPYFLPTHGSDGGFNSFQDIFYNGCLAYSGIFGLVVGDDSVGEDIHCNGFHIVGEHKTSSCYECLGLGASR